MSRPTRLPLLLALCLATPSWADEPAAEDGESADSTSEPAPPASPAEPTAGSPVAPPGPIVDPDVAALQARVLALEHALADARAVDARQEGRLRRLEDLQLDVEGHYRTRAYAFPGLTGPDARDPRYMDMRLRVRPTVDYKGLASFTAQVDALENVVWGDNAGLASTPIFADDPSTTQLDGRTVPSVRITRAWFTATLPLGELRIGRQPSHWGLGLLANDGNGFDDTFGENRTGNTFDRVLFATRPIALGQAIAGKRDTEIPLFFAIGIDRLVEDPLDQYYGYRCESGLTEGVDEAYDQRCDADGDGFSDIEHDYTEERDEGSRRPGWWQDQDDDVPQLVVALIYRGEDLRLLSQSDDLTVGAYLVRRWQRETDSDVTILDAYIDADLAGIRLQAEALHIGGRSSGLVLPGAYDPTGAVDDPLYKDVDIWGYVARAGYRSGDWEALLEHGYAGGDGNVADERFTGRALHPDHNVGLLLYEEILARVSAEQWGEDARPLWSQGGVYNSRYLFPHGTWRPLDPLQLVGGFLVAWPDQPDGSIVLCRPGDDCPQTPATAGPLGWEVDLGAKLTLHEHVLMSLEVGYARATDRLPLAAAGLNPEGRFFTVQSRMAYAF